MKEWDDMSDIAKIRVLRRTAECLRRGGEDAAWIKPEYREDFADGCDAEADRIEAGEEGLEEEANPEQLKAEAENARQIAELLKRYDAGSLSTLLKRYGVVVDEDDDEAATWRSSPPCTSPRYDHSIFSSDSGQAKLAGRTKLRDELDLEFFRQEELCPEK
jgi:hypothetical protein